MNFAPKTVGAMIRAVTPAGTASARSRSIAMSMIALPSTASTLLASPIVMPRRVWSAST